MVKKSLSTIDDDFLQLSPSQKININYLKNFFLKYTNKIYIVGGTLRNFYLNLEHNTKSDIDIEVHNIDIELFTKLMDDLEASGVGKSFFVYKWRDIDISLPRTESKVGYGHKGFDVQLALNEKSASNRRDFTMNSIMLNIYTNEIIDYHNGIKDIDSKIVKIINKDTFKDDSLRVLRAIRFCSVYNLRIQAESLNIISSIKIDDLSNQRIINELEQIFLSDYLEIGFYYLVKTNIIFQLFHKNITFEEFISIYKIIKKEKTSYQDNLKEFYFLFILKNKLNINLSLLNLPKKYKFIGKEPIINSNITDQDIYILSTTKPIKEYLSATNLTIIKRAKELGIYDNKLNLDIDIKSILDDGFEKEEIKIEIKKRELIEIKKLL